MGDAVRKEKPIITPDETLNFIHPTEYPLKKALLAFMPVRGMNDLFCGETATKHPLIQYGHYTGYWSRADGTIFVGPIFGGPLCSMVLEELSVFGVRDVVGYGYSGSLDVNIPPGSIMIAESGLCSDGTSKEYTDDSEVYADAEMFRSLKSLIQSQGIEPEVGKVWTADAIYREFPSKIAHWKSQGARFVNLETASFYAVAREKGIRAVYMSVVSDNVDSDKWSHWFPNLSEVTEKMWSICLEMIDAL